MTKQEWISITGQHMRRGCPEADNTLNSANISYIRDRAKQEPNLKLLKLEPFSIHEPGKNIYNFSCEYILNATEADYPRIESLVKEVYQGITFEKLGRLYKILETDYNGECVLWS
jgi:hypothetical protein